MISYGHGNVGLDKCGELFIGTCDETLEPFFIPVTFILLLI